MHQDMLERKVDNIIHAAKITRMGEMHILKAKAMIGKLKSEITKVRRAANSSKIDGVKHLSKAIGDKPAKPLTCVVRDRDTADGGKKGEITTNPKDVDAIVKRAWKAIYDGMAGCMETAVQTFLEAYTKYILKSKTHEVPESDGAMVFNSFSKTA